MNKTKKPKVKDKGLRDLLRLRDKYKSQSKATKVVDSAKKPKPSVTEEAVDKAIKKMLEDDIELFNKGYDKGFSEALQEVDKIVKEHFDLLIKFGTCKEDMTQCLVLILGDFEKLKEARR